MILLLHREFLGYSFEALCFLVFFYGFAPSRLFVIGVHSLGVLVEGGAGMVGEVI